MSDAALDALADGDGRLRTTLLGQRGRLRDPLLDVFCSAFDRWLSLIEQYRQASASGADEAELDVISTEADRAHWRMLLAWRAIEKRKG